MAWAHDSSSKLPSIGFNNFTAMSKLTRYVLSLGHKNIGMISSWIETNDRARARVMAVQHVMSISGLNAGDLALIETDYGIDTGAAAFNQIMERHRAPTVIICGNDVLGAGALTQANKLGINVPDDVSLTGFDDIELAQVISPTLTTVHVPHRDMGTKAARRLVDMVNGRDLLNSIELPVSIKKRSSLGAPARNTRQRQG